MLDQIEHRLVRVSRLLKRSFGSEKALSKALRDSVTFIDKNDNFSVDDLKMFVLTSCKDHIAHKNISKQDVESFLSALVYNAYGATNIGTVAEMVFSEENYVAKQLSRKIRANPPPEEVNEEVLQSISIDGPINYKKAGQVLSEIEQKVYFGGLPRGGTFQTVYRKIFDCDGDGFVSHADFEEACRKLQIRSDASAVMQAIRVLDKDQKGFFDYNTFSKRMGPGVGEKVSAMINGGEVLSLPEVE